MVTTQIVRTEYESRLSQWTTQAEERERAHRCLGFVRFALMAGLAALAILLGSTRAGLGFAFSLLTFGFFLSGLFHDRILKARDRARRAMRFYQAGLDRLDGTWAQKSLADRSASAAHGTEFLDPHHPFASDLDLFGAGSLFELINNAQTQSGRSTLARWLLAPAAPEEITARQKAVDELRSKLDLRERLGLIAAETQGWIRTESLMKWAAQPRLLQSNFARVIAFCLPFATLTFYFSGQWGLFVAGVAAQLTVFRIFHRAVRQVVRDAGVAPMELDRLAEILRCLESETFQSERLRQMESESQRDGLVGSKAIERLGRLYAWMTSGNNLVVAVVCHFFLWETQFAFAIENWRARFGPKVEVWLRRLAEFEALSSLAGYAYEHPADIFPELLPATNNPQIEAEGLGHPLIPESRCIRNDLAIGSQNRLIMISGSNMSGKSTWLRAIGVNVVGSPGTELEFAL